MEQKYEEKKEKLKTVKKEDSSRFNSIVSHQQIEKEVPPKRQTKNESKRETISCYNCVTF